MPLRYGKPGAEEVTLDDLEAFLNAWARAMLVDGVKDQVRELELGLSEFFPPSALAMFAPEELQALLSGGGAQPWSAEHILANIDCRHGYEKSSMQVQELVAFMSELTGEQQRLFLRFVTSVPRLPLNGWAGLRPQFTVVKKHPMPGMMALVVAAALLLPLKLI